MAGKFVKNDPRTCRDGRPKLFSALREIAQKIAWEKHTLPNKKQLTLAEIILRKWAKSSQFLQQKAFLEIAFGRVPEEIQNDTVIKVILPTEVRAWVEDKVETKESPENANTDAEE